jgi:hypothetical protein
MYDKLEEEVINMQTMIVYAIGMLAVAYFAITLWKKIKGQGACCSSGGCGGCGSSDKCK